MDDELLQYAIEHDIINVSYVQEQIKMNKRKELLAKHPYKIWEGKDGKWRTYIPNGDERRLVKRASKESIENEVIAYWKQELENPTIREVFEEWNDRRLSLKKIAPSTHQRNKQTFYRHYKEFGEERIKSVTLGEVEEFLEEQIPKYDLTSKAFSNLRTITKGFMMRAKKRNLVSYDVVEFFRELDISDANFKKKVVVNEKEVYDEDELPKVFDYLEGKLDDIRNLGILVMFLTGVRVGELVALKNSDFCGNTFRVCRTETRVPSPGGSGYEYRIKDFPKTEAGDRIAIIPSDYSWVAEKLKEINPSGEYVFFENGKRLTTNTIRRRMERMCKKLGIVPKSPHKARKTYGSILLDNKIDERLVTDVMGHTDIDMTEVHYHRSRKSIGRKEAILSAIPEFRMNEHTF